LPKEKVKELASKIMPMDSAINVYYLDILIASLLGADIQMKRFPVIFGGRPVMSDNGERGIIFKEPPEEKALMRWKDAEFNEAEEILADRWRNSTRSFDMEAFKQNLKETTSTSFNVKDSNSLELAIDNILTNPNIQKSLLKFLISDFPIPIRAAQKIFYRWETENYTYLKEFAPYAYYCFRVNLIFQFSLMHNLIGTKSTNRIDLEYFYYLPFCMVFCSNDNFHKKLCPLFIGKDQRFILLENLKDDLRNMVVYNDKCYYQKTNQSSITAKLWKELMPGPLSERKNKGVKINKNKQKEIVDFLKKKIEKSKTISGKESLFNTQEADFIVRERVIRGGDPCPCGSGKPYIECHGKKNEK